MLAVAASFRSQHDRVLGRREARAVERGIERNVADRQRARGRVLDDLADPEILEKVARIGLAHGTTLPVDCRQVTGNGY